MKAVAAFEILALLTVAVLTICVAEGQLLTKCDLKSRLEVAFSTLSNTTHASGPTIEELVARLVCKAELIGFNTSLVTQKPAQREDEHRPAIQRRRGRSARGSSARGNSRASSSSKDLSSESSESHGESSEEVHGASRYGIFQLCDTVACANGTSTSSRNVCNMDCTKLIDADISDDISCLLNILDGQRNENDGPGGSSSNSEEGRNEFPKQCATVVPSVYFAGCP